MAAIINKCARIGVQTPVMGALRWPGRPEFKEGNAAWSYMVEGTSSQYAVTIGHVDQVPFEVWVLGNEQSRGLGAVAKTLSADMRVFDSKWLNLKIDALTKIVGGNQINQPILKGERLVASSNSAALGKIIQFWMDHEESARHEGTPLIDTLLPPVRSSETIAYAAPVLKPESGDDFILFMPEVETDDGQQMPTGVYLAGRYPPDLDGLTALLSLDMRVSDVAWIGMKLRKLLNFMEPMGDFQARNPETGELTRYPSIIAYMACIMLRRYAVLGLLHPNGSPVISEEPIVKLAA